VADDGVEGNARLTSTTGVILFILFAAIGITILSIRRLVLPVRAGDMGLADFIGGHRLRGAPTRQGLMATVLAWYSPSRC